MMERNAQGRAGRTYFIDCEKQLYAPTSLTAQADAQRMVPVSLAEPNADTRFMTGYSIVMSPSQFSGFKAVLLARQDRLALLGCEVFMVSLQATEDNAIAELTTTSFLKLATPRLAF